MSDRTSGKTKVVLFPAGELPPGGRRLVAVDGVEIAVVNVDGRLYAFGNACPHQGAPMVYGPITGTMLPSAPQQYRYGCDGEVVRCPLHGWEFWLSTGKSIHAPGHAFLRTYDIAEEAGSIVLVRDKPAGRVEIRDAACPLRPVPGGV